MGKRTRQAGVLSLIPEGRRNRGAGTDSRSRVREGRHSLPKSIVKGNDEHR